MDFLVFLVFAVTWAVPIVIVVYLFWALRTIVDGLASIDRGVKRTAAAVEALAARPTRDG